MHFIYYLRQLDSGILTESCFLRLGTGKACEHIRYNSKSASFRPFLSRYCIVWCLLTQNKLTTEQRSSCYSSYFGLWRNFQFLFSLGVPWVEVFSSVVLKAVSLNVLQQFLVPIELVKSVKLLEDKADPFFFKNLMGALGSFIFICANRF